MEPNFKDSISSSGFSRDPKLSVDAFPYPFTLFKCFLFKASWRVSVEDCFQYLWPSSVKLLFHISLWDVFFSFILLLLLTHTCFALFFHATMHRRFYLLGVCALFLNFWSHKPWKRCDLPGRGWLEVMEETEWFFGIVACWFLVERPWNASCNGGCVCVCVYHP